MDVVMIRCLLHLRIIDRARSAALFLAGMRLLKPGAMCAFEAMEKVIRGSSGKTVFGVMGMSVQSFS